MNGVPLGRFLARNALADFRHRARLFAALADGTCTPRDLPRALRLTPTCGELVNGGFAATAPAASTGAYADSVAADWAALRRAVAAHPPQHACDARVFDMVPGFRFWVFECTHDDDGEVLGCVLDYDPRLTDEATWVRFFG